jgi:hypothetical protein
MFFCQNAILLTAKTFYICVIDMNANNGITKLFSCDFLFYFGKKLSLNFGCKKCRLIVLRNPKTYYISSQLLTCRHQQIVRQKPEPEFLNFKGSQESIPRNQFRPVRQSYSYSVPSRQRLFKNSITAALFLVFIS